MLRTFCIYTLSILLGSFPHFFPVFAHAADQAFDDTLNRPHNESYTWLVIHNGTGWSWTAHNQQIHEPAKWDTYTNVSDGLPRSVIPEPIVDPLADKFEWWLWAVRVLRWHVEIIHERQHLLSTDRHIDTFRTFLHAAFNDVLNVVWWRLLSTLTSIVTSVNSSW